MCWHNLADFLYGARQRDNFSLLKGLSFKGQIRDVDQNAIIGITWLYSKLQVKHLDSEIINFYISIISIDWSFKVELLCSVYIIIELSDDLVM